MRSTCKCTSDNRTGAMCGEHPGETRLGLPCRPARCTSAGLQTGPEPSQELESWSHELLGAKFTLMWPPPALNSLSSPWSGAGCQPDRSAGTRAAGGPRGSQVRGGRLLPASRGAAPPAVPQVSQPAAQPRAHPAGGPRPGSPCDPLLSPREWEGRTGCTRQALPGCRSITQGPRLGQRLCACPRSCRKLRSP